MPASAARSRPPASPIPGFLRNLESDFGQYNCARPKMVPAQRRGKAQQEQIKFMNNRSNHTLNSKYLACVAIALASITWPQAEAVTPAPDRGYPNRNTAEGTDALFSWPSTTSDGENTAIGFDALLQDNSGTNNTATGSFALFSNTSGSFNTAIGFEGLQSNTTPYNNTAVGAVALGSNTTATEHTPSRPSASAFTTTRSTNPATGFAAPPNSTANNNTATGFQALLTNTSGSENTAMGSQALLNNVSGGDNTGTGISALLNNTTGSSNTASGGFALFSNKNGSFNTASGLNALRNNNAGSSNTAAGIQALNNNTSGSNNVAVGALAGQNLTTGNNNIDIGAPGNAGEANTIRIGKQGTQKSTFVAGIFGAAVSGSTVVVSSTGKLGVASSSARFKQAIKPMDKASEAILALKPVSFQYKEEIDPEGIPQFGLIAEEVEKVNPDLVGRDENGKVSTVRYEAVNAMLLNEFLKEHRMVEDQEAAIAQLKASMAQQQEQIESLNAMVQKVSNERKLDERVSAVLTSN